MFVDAVARLELVHHSLKVGVGSEMALEVRALDAAGDVFSTLEVRTHTHTY